MNQVKKIHDIIIVGAGLSGLGCAKKLHDNGRSFIIISENVGGRVRTSPNGKVNYGAYYITADCNNTMPYQNNLRKMRLSDYHFHKENESYYLKSTRIIKHLPALSRLMLDLMTFRRHFNKMREKSFEYSREEIIEADPLLKKYYNQKASEYIKEKGLDSLVREYFEQLLWGSFFIDPHKVPTFIFLQCLLPILVKSYAFEFDFNRLVEPFKKTLVADSIVEIKRKNGNFILKTKTKKEYQCEKLILAMPMWITNKLVKPQKIKDVIPVSYYHLKGKIKPEYSKARFNFFQLEDHCATSLEKDGTYLYFYKGKQQLQKYFLKWEIITKGAWKPALQLLGDQYTNLNPQKNLFIASDHDVASIEDAFINGHYTAKLVLES